MKIFKILNEILLNLFTCAKSDIFKIPPKIQHRLSNACICVRYVPDFDDEYPQRFFSNKYPQNVQKRIYSFIFRDLRKF